MIDIQGLAAYTTLVVCLVGVILLEAIGRGGLISLFLLVGAAAAGLYLAFVHD